MVKIKSMKSGEIPIDLIFHLKLRPTLTAQYKFIVFCVQMHHFGNARCGTDHQERSWFIEKGKSSHKLFDNYSIYFLVYF